MRLSPKRHIAALSAIISLAAAMQETTADYFRPTKQAAAPEITWTRNFDPGLGGNLVADQKGGVYLWYETDSRVIKYDSKGKLQWDKRFTPKGKNAWCSIFENSKGELYLSRQEGEEAILAKLLPTGKLQSEVRFSKDKALIAGRSAITAGGGWINIDSRKKSLDEPQSTSALRMCAQEFLSKYSSAGVRESSTYLQDVTLELETDISTCQSTVLALEMDPQGNSYVLKGDFTQDGVINVTLSQYAKSNETAWNTQLPLESNSRVILKMDSSNNSYIVSENTSLGYSISKIDKNGKLLWLRKPASRTNETLQEAAVDHLGCLYVAGTSKNAGFVAKHDSSGQLVWRKELPKLRSIAGLAVQNASVYVSGDTRDRRQMYLIKLSN